jgi:hypothetical protein
MIQAICRPENLPIIPSDFTINRNGTDPMRDIAVLTNTSRLKVISIQMLMGAFWLTGASVCFAENDSLHSQASQKTAPYYQDAQLCRAKSRLDPMPEGADPSISIDPQKFLRCINGMGYHQEAKSDPFMVALKRCFSEKRRSVSISGEEKLRAPSQAQVRACLATRGFLSTGTPPNPNAPADAAVTPPPPKTDSSAAPPRTGAEPTGTPMSEGQVETVIIPPRNKPRN